MLDASLADYMGRDQDPKQTLFFQTQQLAKPSFAEERAVSAQSWSLPLTAVVCQDFKTGKNMTEADLQSLEGFRSLLLWEIRWPVVSKTSSRSTRLSLREGEFPGVLLRHFARG